MKKDKPGCDTQTCMVCRLCMKEWLPAVEAGSKHFTYRKGQELFREGDPVKGIFFIYKGSVKVHKHWDEEKELILRFARKGDIVGHRGIGLQPVYPVTATALEQVTVCYFDLVFWEASLKVNQPLLYELMLFYARELQESERKMRNLAHMPVKGRIAQALVSLEKQFGRNENGFIGFTLSRQDLASYIGATYETTFRILQEMIQEHLVVISGKEIAITDEARLLRLCGLPEGK
ncbi:Crp/Fnr family transcriptional regulator [Chitinophaga sp. GCM10012297]|uniref:Crp/Fnr family transcriptional regulator n=1 Tax=Chitinophaga chungangae TaxID=2821488 RepID=A0ABS3Y9C9_9BACT|nr:Crp/Fnr family transcriptional regulator [Chitinophaga chungangae]MBO9151241.1 Crp/Fnr family transcriptional regulator [Chitinophaga chungangae]